MLNRRPWGPLCWVLAFFTASYQQLLWSPNSIGVPEGPLGRVWLSLPHLVYNSLSNRNCNYHLTSVLTELYKSSTPTRSPTRSLESHVWSSSSGNNCHAVHRSLSSGASVYECTMGIFISSHFISQFPPTRFPLIIAIRMCHFLPVHHLGMAFLAGSKAKIQQMYIELVWRRYEATFKLRSVIPLFEINEMTEYPRKRRQPTSIGITWHIQVFSTQSTRRVLYRFSLHSCASSRFSSQGTVNSIRRILFWIGPCYHVWPLFCLNDVNWNMLRSTGTFQSLARFSSFISEVFSFPHWAFTFLVKLNYGILGCNRLLVCCLTLCSLQQHDHLQHLVMSPCIHLKRLWTCREHMV